MVGDVLLFAEVTSPSMLLVTIRGTARRDIINLHYGLLLLHFSDKTSVTETYPQ